MSGGVPVMCRVVARSTLDFTVRSGPTHDNLVKVEEPAWTRAGISNDGLTEHILPHHRTFSIHPHADESTALVRGRPETVLAGSPAATVDDDEHRE